MFCIDEKMTKMTTIRKRVWGSQRGDHCKRHITYKVASIIGCQRSLKHEPVALWKLDLRSITAFFTYFRLRARLPSFASMLQCMFHCKRWYSVFPSIFDFFFISSSFIHLPFEQRAWIAAFHMLCDCCYCCCCCCCCCWCSARICVVSSFFIAVLFLCD